MLFTPGTYEEWKHCITVDCAIPLTPHFVQERIAALTDKRDFHTQKFIESWGPPTMPRRSHGFAARRRNWGWRHSHPNGRRFRRR